MIRKLAPLTAAFLALALSAAPSQKPAVAKLPAPPATAPKAVTETLQGVAVTDNYRWLENQDAPETRAWIDGENAYTDKILGNLPDKPRFAKRIEELQKVDVMTTPDVRGGRYFFTKRAAGQDLFSIYMREGAAGPDILLIDPAPLSPKHTTSIGLDDISNDGKLLAYWVREGGADETSTHFLDVDARKETGAPLEKARYFGVSLTGDKQTLYFTRNDKEGPRVYHRPVAGRRGDEGLRRRLWSREDHRLQHFGERTLAAAGGVLRLGAEEDGALRQGSRC